MRETLENREDIERLVDRFYAKVRRDDVIGYIFNDVMDIHWETHLPRICDFWEAVLFRETKFAGNPLQKHSGVDDKERLRPEHFERWLSLFRATIDDLFEGDLAEDAKRRAGGIAEFFQGALEQKHGRRSPLGLKPVEGAAPLIDPTKP